MTTRGGGGEGGEVVTRENGGRLYEGHAIHPSDSQTQHLHFIRADIHTHFRVQRFHLGKKDYNSYLNINNENN
jgi:hypothetical protein